MAGFLYFKPGLMVNNQVTREEVRAWGLGYAFEKKPSARDGCSVGGVKGHIFADESRLGEYTFGVYEHQQTWRKIPGRDDGIWVGYYTEAPPKPEDLIRKEYLDGYVIKIGDGKWTIPLVRSFDVGAGLPRSALPCYVDLDDDGKACQGQVLEVYKHLWDLTESYAASIMGGEATEGDVDVFETAIKLLQTNYVIDKIEAVQMKLFHDKMPATCVLLHAVDYGSFLQWMENDEKKSTAGTDSGLNTSAGGEG